MKNINIALEDSEYKELIEDKGSLTWKEYLMRKEELTDAFVLLKFVDYLKKVEITGRKIPTEMKEFINDSINIIKGETYGR